MRFTYRYFNKIVPSMQISKIRKTIRKKIRKTKLNKKCILTTQFLILYKNYKFRNNSWKLYMLKCINIIESKILSQTPKLVLLFM